VNAVLGPALLAAVVVSAQGSFAILTVAFGEDDRAD